jgi:flagellar basal-body rod protein FlgF
MDNDLLIGLSRQATLERQFDVVANNIANLNTSGYKASTTVFAEYLMPGARENQFSGADRQLHFVHNTAGFRNFSQGPIQQTGNPLDIAIDGDAFLAVQTPGGERYTRNGSLKINATGQLVTALGTVVNGDNGPITFQPNDREISISADGRITVLDGPTHIEAQRGKLKVVNFAQPQQLQGEGDNLFAVPAGVNAQPATSVRVVQGAVEGSNVNAVGEMSRMIEINRTYSTIASLLQSQTDQRQTALDKLAEVPN